MNQSQIIKYSHLQILLQNNIQMTSNWDKSVIEHTCRQCGDVDLAETQITMFTFWCNYKHTKLNKKSKDCLSHINNQFWERTFKEKIILKKGQRLIINEGRHFISFRSSKKRHVEEERKCFFFTIFSFFFFEKKRKT